MYLLRRRQTSSSARKALALLLRIGLGTLHFRPEDKRLDTRNLLVTCVHACVRARPPARPSARPSVHATSVRILWSSC